MATTTYKNNQKKKKKKKSSIRYDRVFLCIGILALILALVLYLVNYSNKTKIEITPQDVFSNIRACLSVEEVTAEQTEDTSISLEDYTTNSEPLSSVSSEDLSAQYMYVIDYTNKQILFDKHSEDRCYPASTTKILTSVVALEYINPDTIFTVGTETSFVEEGSSMAYVKQGDQIALKDLLYGLMLPSGNDVAYVIAVNTARIVSNNNLLTDAEAVEYFVNLMNKTAKSIGMDNSNFVVPDGFHNNEHYSTPKDLMKLLIYAQQFDLLKTVASTPVYTLQLSDDETYTWYNTNSLLDENNSYYDSHVNGFKTGFHDSAGYCLIFTANIEGNDIFAVEMKSETDDTRYQDANTILNALNPNAQNEQSTDEEEY